MSSFIAYEYEADSKGNQYSDLDYLKMKGVEARYIHYDSDAGNPYIEALPRPRNAGQLNVACRRGIPGYQYDLEIKKDAFDQILSVLRLRDVRVPLPVNYELENEIFTALILSYRARNMFRDEGGDIQLEYKTKNRTQHTDGILIGQDAAATNAGITMIGYSGCGKSSSLETVFRNYPQYIIHRGRGMTTYPQIVYLVVQCPPHSNFRGLYKNIGVAIDKALGNVKPVYAKELDAGPSGNLAIYNDKVRECIERFAIGIIIFDEIQHIHFDTTLENSFESILELSNQTKVAFGVVGTEDSYDKIFSGNLRQARRLGSEIHADRYCKNRELFNYITKQLFAYQWFSPIVEPDESMIDALYECTKGIIDQLIGTYMYMNIDYIRASKKPKVNARYVETVVERHYPGMMDILRDLTDPVQEAKRASLAKKANDELADIEREERAKRAERAVMEANKGPDAEQIIALKQIVVSRIMGIDERFPADTIENVVDHIITSEEGKKNIDNETVIARMTYQKLNGMKAAGRKQKTDNKKTDTRKTQISPATALNYIMNDDTQD